MELIKGIRVPGVIWFILIIVGVAVVHENTTNPLYYDLAIMAAGFLLRSVTNNRAELEQYQEAFNMLKERLRQKSVAPPPPSDMRSSRQVENVEAAELQMPVVEPPSPLSRFFWG